MLATLAMIIVSYSSDAQLMCGPNPLEACLIWADQCLQAGTTLFDADQAFEQCSEMLDPKLVR